MSEAASDRLITLFREVLPRSPFYAHKFAAAGLDPTTLAATDLPRLPFTTKPELLADQDAHPPYGTVLTEAPARYHRLHQTSGTSGKPLRWLDTPASWTWLLDCWRALYAIAGVGAADRLFFPFSFGPFLGFWTAFEAALREGYFCMPGGGMTSAARLRFLLGNAATVVLATPTYALRLAEVAEAEGIDLRSSPVRLLLVAGEPGGSIPATRARIEAAWGARVIDHSGMTEVGPVALECVAGPGGLHLLESEYVAEVVDAQGQPAPPGEPGELVLTNLGRCGSPLVRYRSGDVVCVDPNPCPCGRTFRRLDGGIRGRTDDMVLLRGNCVYPSAVEAVVRRFAEVAEYRMIVDSGKALATLRLEVEPLPSANDAALAERVEQAVREVLLFRPEVVVVPSGSLPRFEMKAKRLVRT